MRLISSPYKKHIIINWALRALKATYDLQTTMKIDIQLWRKDKNVEGLTVVIKCWEQTANTQNRDMSPDFVWMQVSVSQKSEAD